MPKLTPLVSTLFGVSLMAFFLIRLAPGDPVLLLLGERGADPVVYKAMQERLGLQGPLLVQYKDFLLRALQGDLGRSIVSRADVWEEFWDRFPATLELGLVSLAWALVVGIPLGIGAAVGKNTLWGRGISTVALVGYSMPLFWLALMLILIFSVGLELTPVSGQVSALYDVPHWSGLMLVDSLTPGALGDYGLSAFWSALHHLALPALTLATIPLAMITRMTRASFLEVLDRPCLLVARAKGAPTLRVLFVHALKNALIPIITVSGVLLATIITGAVLTESIFGRPGVGRWFVESAMARDYPVLEGGVLLLGAFIVGINSFTDFLLRWVDPAQEGPK